MNKILITKDLDSNNPLVKKLVESVLPKYFICLKELDSLIYDVQRFDQGFNFRQTWPKKIEHDVYAFEFSVGTIILTAESNIDKTTEKIEKFIRLAKLHSSNVVITYHNEEMFRVHQGVLFIGKKSLNNLNNKSIKVALLEFSRGFFSNGKILLYKLDEADKLYSTVHDSKLVVTDQELNKENNDLHFLSQVQAIKSNTKYNNRYYRDLTHLYDDHLLTKKPVHASEVEIDHSMENKFHQKSNSIASNLDFLENDFSHLEEEINLEEIKANKKAQAERLLAEKRELELLQLSELQKEARLVADKVDYELEQKPITKYAKSFSYDDVLLTQQDEINFAKEQELIKQKEYKELNEREKNFSKENAIHSDQNLEKDNNFDIHSTTLNIEQKLEKLNSLDGLADTPNFVQQKEEPELQKQDENQESLEQPNLIQNDFLNQQQNQQEVSQSENKEEQSTFGSEFNNEENNKPFVDPIFLEQNHIFEKHKNNQTDLSQEPILSDEPYVSEEKNDDDQPEFIQQNDFNQATEANQQTNVVEENEINQNTDFSQYINVLGNSESENEVELNQDPNLVKETEEVSVSNDLSKDLSSEQSTLDVGAAFDLNDYHEKFVSNHPENLKPQENVTFIEEEITVEEEKPRGFFARLFGLKKKKKDAKKALKEAEELVSDETPVVIETKEVKYTDSPYLESEQNLIEEELVEEKTVSEDIQNLVEKFGNNPDEEKTVNEYEQFAKDNQKVLNIKHLEKDIHYFDINEEALLRTLESYARDPIYFYTSNNEML